MSPAHPSQQELFARGIHPWRVGGFHTESAQPRAGRIAILSDIDQIQESVGGEARMEGQSESLRKGTANFAQIEGHIGGGGLRTGNKRNQAPTDLQHPQPRSRWVIGQFHWILELKPRKHTLHLNPRGRLRRTLNPPRSPRNARLGRGQKTHPTPQTTPQPCDKPPAGEHGPTLRRAWRDFKHGQRTLQPNPKRLEHPSDLSGGNRP